MLPIRLPILWRLLRMLNSKQETAITSAANRIIINASAGTGKTSAIIAAAESNRFGNTVLITFTNKAADEMSVRLSYKPFFVGTIHKFARLELLKLAQEKDFRVRLLKEQSIRKIIKLIFDENDFGMYVSNAALNEAYHVIINTDIELPQRKMKIYYEVKKLYDKYKEQNQLYDLTDTPKYLLKKLQDHDLYLNHDLVLVDEAQDLDEIQYALIQRLGRRTIVIGDPNQSIYVFRGATREIFNRFIEDGYELHNFDINYRSKQEIITNAGIELLCERGSGGEILNDTRILWYAPMILCRTNHEVDEIRKNYPRVMTIHAAKGLEFDNVCVIDFNVDDEQDKNIMFVALTRAKDRIGVLKFHDALNYLYNT